MVRSYLIESRICFESDKGSGYDLEDEDINRELQQDVAAAAAGLKGKDQGGTYSYSPGFDPNDPDTRRAIEATKSISQAASRGQDAVDRAERAAAADAATRGAVDRLTGMAPIYEEREARVRPAIHKLHRAAVKSQLTGRSPYAPTTSTRATGQDSRFYGDAYRDLYNQNPRGTTLQQIAQIGPANRLASELTGRTQRSPREEAAYQAGQMLSAARSAGQGMTREQEAGLIGNNVGGTITNTSEMFDPGTGTFTDVPIGSRGGTMSTGIFGGPVYTGPPDESYSGPFEDQVRGFRGEERTERGDDKTPVSVFGGQMDTSAVGQSAANAGAIPSSELAIDYLQNPYFQYSGFGNQFFPYGYAPNTLVDLLQTRNLTQPSQADTLGLFGNPTDFS